MLQLTGIDRNTPGAGGRGPERLISGRISVQHEAIRMELLDRCPGRPTQGGGPAAVQRHAAKAGRGTPGGYS